MHINGDNSHTVLHWPSVGLLPLSARSFGMSVGEAGSSRHGVDQRIIVTSLLICMSNSSALCTAGSSAHRNQVSFGFSATRLVIQVLLGTPAMTNTLQDL